jgi:hypothetical protein
MLMAGEDGSSVGAGLGERVGLGDGLGGGAVAAEGGRDGWSTEEP